MAPKSKSAGAAGLVASLAGKVAESARHEPAPGTMHRGLQLVSDAMAAQSNPVPGKTGVSGYAEFDPRDTYEIGARVVLPLNQIIENPLNPRFHIIPSEIQTLVKSIGQSGQQEAVQVYAADEHGKFMLKSGHRRAKALAILGRATAKAEVVARSGSALTEYKQAREINTEHKSQSHFDDAKRWAQLIEELNIDQSELAQELGIGKSDVSKVLSIGELPDDLQATMAQHLDNFTFSSSYLIYGYWTKTGKNGPATEKLVNSCIEGKLSFRKLKDLVSSSVQAPAERRQQRALSRAAVSGFASGELKAFEGKLTLQLACNDDVQRDALYLGVLGLLEKLDLKVEKAAAQPAPDGVS